MRNKYRIYIKYYTVLFKVIVLEICNVAETHLSILNDSHSLFRREEGEVMKPNSCPICKVYVSMHLVHLILH
jgi:hypothetical protein